MRHAILCLLLAATSAGAQVVRKHAVKVGGWGPNDVNMNDNPEMYWNRGFGCSGMFEVYNVNLRVDDLDAAARKVDKAVEQSGSAVPNGNNGNEYYGGGREHYKRRSYTIPVKQAEKLAKKLMDIGELQNYSVNRQNSEDSKSQLEERVGILEKELENKDALAKMPAASFFLRNKLAGYKSALETCQRSNSQSAINVTLQEKKQPAVQE